MIYFAFGMLGLWGLYIYLSYKEVTKKIDENYTCPSYHGSLIKPIKEDKIEEVKPENKEKQKIKIK